MKKKNKSRVWTAVLTGVSIVFVFVLTINYKPVKRSASSMIEKK